MRALLAVIRPLGVIGMVMSLSHLVPITLSLYYGDGAVRAFCVSMLFNFTVSLIAFFAARGLKLDRKSTRLNSSH